MSADNPNLATAKLRSFGRTILQRDVPSAALDGGGRGVVVDGTAIFVAATSAGSAGGVRELGPALRWASSKGAGELHLVAEGEVAHDLARRASLLGRPIVVWRARGAELVPADPRPLTPPPEPPAAHWAMAGLIADAGARVVDDHGLLVAEVAGLEVARVVEGEEGPRLDVGVGQADRELQQYVNGHLDDDTNLRRAIAAVATHRRADGGGHPLARMARERWLRSVLLDDPSPVGATELIAAVPLRPRATVLGGVPAVASGPGIVVVCSVGVDLDLIPEAADHRAAIDADAEVVLVLPERDRRLAAGPVTDLLGRVRVVSIPEPWGSVPPR